jgi:hypothetical protein
MINIADKNAPIRSRGLCLRMAFEAKVRIALHKHFGVYGAVRIVADRATFSHRGVLEYEWPRLLAMTLGASLVFTRHRQPTCRFHDVHPVWIVALHAAHLALDDRVMLREVKFCPGFLVALEATFGVLAGINDEFLQTAASGHGDVFAARTVAGFAPILSGHFGIGDPQSRVRAAGEGAGNVRMTINTRLVTNVGGAFNLQRNHHRTVCGAGVQQEEESASAGANC